MKVVIHAYKEGKKLYYRGNLEVTPKMTLESAIVAIGKLMNEPLLEIVEDRSEYTIVVFNDKAIEFEEERNRIVTNEDNLKLFPQVVGG